MITISQLKDDTISFIAQQSAKEEKDVAKKQKLIDTRNGELEKRFAGVKDDRFIYGILECHLLGAIPLLKPELISALKSNAAFTEGVYRIADRALESANMTVRPIRESIYEKSIRGKK